MMNHLALIGKIISKETNRTGLGNVRGGLGEVNVHGEEVQKLDQYANDICKSALKHSGLFALLASEEEKDVVYLGKGKFVIAFDPLDGSSNIDVNGSVGTIFSVLPVRSEIALSERQFFQSGRNQVLAGYMLYGSSTVLVFSFGDGVYEFTLDPAIGEFFLSSEHIQIPEQCLYYSVNEGNTQHMRLQDVQFIASLRDELRCSARYVGSLVADVHRNMHKGGIFLYPALDTNATGVYAGKLRLNYELKPLAFLIEQAGGAAVDGNDHLLDIEATSLHERCAAVMGNIEVVKMYVA